MHSHLIPGIDDGAKTVEQSVELIKELMALGFTKLITTPHIMEEYYPNNPAVIRNGLEKVKSALKAEGLSIPIEAAAEYYVDESFERLLDSGEELLCFSDDRILIEFSTFSAPANLYEVIFSLTTRGLRPILAHPERYLYFKEDFAKFEKIKSLGCTLQVNLLSLAGHYGPEQKKLAIRLLKAKMVDYLGTDLHRKSHLEKLKTMENDRTVRKLLAQTVFLNSKL